MYDSTGWKSHVLHPWVRYGVGFHPNALETGATPCLQSGPSCKAGMMSWFGNLCKLANPTSIPTTSINHKVNPTPAFHSYMSAFIVFGPGSNQLPVYAKNLFPRRQEGFQTQSTTSCNLPHVRSTCLVQASPYQKSVMASGTKSKHTVS